MLQRVSRAAVRVDGQAVGAIGRGFLVLAGFAPADTEPALAWMADKIAGLRLFADAEVRPAMQTVMHSRAYPSHLTLPIAPARRS